MKKILVVCTTDSMIYNFLIPQIKLLEQMGNCVECACSRTGKYFDVLSKEKGLIVHKVDFVRSPYSLKNIGAYKTLKQLVKDNEYDVIFCHEPVGGMMGRLVGRKLKMQVIYMCHGFHFYNGCPKKNKLIYYKVEKFLSKYTDVIITINNEDFEAAKKLKSRRVYKVNGVGIDLSKFSNDDYSRDDILKKTEINAENSMIVLSVGELIERKNQKAIIESMSLIKDIDLKCYICGTGPLNQDLQKLIIAKGLTEKVFLLGYRDDINDLDKICDVFLFTSYQEGLPVAVMEAMASEKPCVVSKIRGNEDLVIENKGGYVVKVDDYEGYAKALTELYNDKEKREQFGVFNRNRMSDFGDEQVMEQFRNIFNDIFIN